MWLRVSGTNEEKGCCTSWPAGGVIVAEGTTDVSEF